MSEHILRLVARSEKVNKCGAAKEERGKGEERVLIWVRVCGLRRYTSIGRLLFQTLMSAQLGFAVQPYY